jgi:hypothetical protein
MGQMVFRSLPALSPAKNRPEKKHFSSSCQSFSSSLQLKGPTALKIRSFSLSKVFLSIFRPQTWPLKSGEADPRFSMKAYTTPNHIPLLHPPPPAPAPPLQPTLPDPAFSPPLQDSSPTTSPSGPLPWNLNPFMDISIIRRQFPHLHEAPDDFLRSQSYGELAKANAALAKSAETASYKALDKRLATNFRELKSKKNQDFRRRRRLLLPPSRSPFSPRHSRPCQHSLASRPRGSTRRRSPPSRLL